MFVLCGICQQLDHMHPNASVCCNLPGSADAEVAAAINKTPVVSVGLHGTGRKDGNQLQSRAWQEALRHDVHCKSRIVSILHVSQLLVCVSKASQIISRNSKTLSWIVGLIKFWVSRQPTCKMPMPSEQRPGRKRRSLRYGTFVVRFQSFIR